MRFRTFFILTLPLAASIGCSTTFTSIEKQPDNSYVMTMTKQGPFFVSGSTWKCTAQAETAMTCTRVGVP